MNICKDLTYSPIIQYLIGEECSEHLNIFMYIYLHAPSISLQFKQ